MNMRNSVLWGFFFSTLFFVMADDELFSLDDTTLDEVEQTVDPTATYDTIKKELGIIREKEPTQFQQFTRSSAQEVGHFLYALLIAAAVSSGAYGGYEVDRYVPIAQRILSALGGMLLFGGGAYGITLAIKKAVTLLMLHRRVNRLNRVLAQWPEVRLHVPKALHPLFEKLYSNFESNGSLGLTLPWNQLEAVLNTIESFIILNEEVTVAQESNK